LENPNQTQIPAQVTQGRQVQLEGQQTAPQRELPQSNPISTELPGGFYDIEVRVDDCWVGHGQTQLALCVAEFNSDCPPPAEAFMPVDSSRFFYTGAVQFDEKECAPCAEPVKGWHCFTQSYERVWKAGQYALGLELSSEELCYFQLRGCAFGGYTPTFTSEANQNWLPFSLDHVSCPPRSATF
jgi:hypothetical protein